MKKLWDWCWEMYRKYKELVNYLIVGGLTTVLALGVYYGSVLTFLDPKNFIQLQIANCLSWTSGVVFSYIMNRIFVFESTETNKLKEIGKFVSSRVITLFMDMAIMAIGVSWLKFNDKIMKLVSQVVITISNYIFSKLFVFKTKKDDNKTLEENKEKI